MMDTVKSPVGNTLHCANWNIEAAYRLLQNNLDPDVAEEAEHLIVYGGIGKAARNWPCFYAIKKTLKTMQPDETLLIQSGKPVGVLPSHPWSPRVLIANSNLVHKWATWEHFDELDKKGLIMYGQMTAGSWIYIGSQGIVQGTYETFMACGKKHFANTSQPLLGKTIISGGLGGMGGAQPLAVKLAGGVFIGVDINNEKVQRRFKQSYLDEIATSLEDAMQRAQKYAAKKTPRSIGLVGNIAEILPLLLKKDFIPDIVTDQTSAHDPLNGYYPVGLTKTQADALRSANPKQYRHLSMQSIATHVKCMLEFQRRSSIVFDYGNNIRGVAKEAGVTNAFDFPGFVAEFIRPIFCEGGGPFRWVALSGNAKDIELTDRVLLELFPKDKTLVNWLEHGAPQIPYQGLPSRICWLKYGEREQAGLAFNKLVREGAITAPIAIGRDHLDCGSVASPYRETESMLDGSDTIADWPLLNALINTANGASWVSIHHGGGVGMGLSQHAGMVIVADGSELADQRLHLVLNSDPALGVIRHADAGYTSAIKQAQHHNIKMPML